MALVTEETWIAEGYLKRAMRGVLETIVRSSDVAEEPITLPFCDSLCDAATNAVSYSLKLMEGTTESKTAQECGTP